MNMDVWRACQGELLEEMLAANLRRIGAQELTRRRVLESDSSAQVVSLPDGSLALSAVGGLLGVRPSLGGDNSAVQRVSRADEAAIVVFGLGLGHTVRELRERTHAPIVVFDPDPGVVRASLEFGPSDLGGVRLTCDMEELRALWSSLSCGKPAAAMISTPGYREAYGEVYRELVGELQTLVAASKVSHNTLHYRAHTWITHLARNLDNVVGSRPIGLLEGCYANVPAFIVGAGPSVQKNARWLGEAAKKGIVIGVNSSASVLAQHGVEPQVLVCLEAATHVQQLRALPWIDRVIRALSLTASPATWTMPGGPVMPFHEQMSFFAGIGALFGVEPIPVAGSVSTAAFAIAEMFGCSPIVFVGQDLAFTDGQVHATGTEIENSRVRVDRKAGRIWYDWCDAAKRIYDQSDSIGAPAGEQLTEVTAWGGEGTVVSSSTWNLVRTYLESQALRLHVQGLPTQVINATEGGSRIAGFEEHKLADIVAGIPALGIRTSDLVRAAAYRRAAISRDEVSAWRAEQVRTAVEAGTVAGELDHAVHSALAVLGQEDPREVTEAYARVAVAEESLRDVVRRQPLLDAWCKAAVNDLRLTMGGGADAIEDARSSFLAELKLASVVEEGAREIATLLGESSS